MGKNKDRSGAPENSQVPKKISLIEQLISLASQKTTDEISHEHRETERFINERERSIRAGARRAGKRFRL